MKIKTPQITVGSAWITVCNGMWHAVFVAGDEDASPGSCSCDDSESTSTLFRKVDSLFDCGGEPNRTSSESRARRERGGTRRGH